MMSDLMFYIPEVPNSSLALRSTFRMQSSWISSGLSRTQHRTALPSGKGGSV